MMMMLGSTLKLVEGFRPYPPSNQNVRALKTARLIAAVVTLLLALPVPPLAADETRRYAGRLVADVLRELQPDLRIIFSSDLVPSSLRVKDEPTVRDRRQIALQILSPHGLTLQKGPRGTLLVVASPRKPAPAPRSQPRQAPAPSQPDTAREPAQTPDAMRIDERVEVSGRLTRSGGDAMPHNLEPAAVRETAGGFENVFQVLQLLPGAAATNDEDGRLAIRGAGPEHNIVVLDGVQIHNPYRYSELTSSFLNPATAAGVTLDASGLDARHGGRLSSVTVIETRDGARDRKLGVSGSMGLANGDVLLEGRLPGTDTGSWWATARGTYYRPVVDLFRTDVVPSFGDVQMKVTVRPSRRTSLSVFGLAGLESTLPDGRQREDFHGFEFAGRNLIGIANLSWTPNPKLVTTTTLSGYRNRALDFDMGISSFEREVRVRDAAARQRIVYAFSPRHLLDAGFEVHGIRSSWRMTGMRPAIFWRGLGPSTWGEQIRYADTGLIDSRLSRTGAGFWVQDRVPIGKRSTVEPGIRLDWNSFTGEASWQPRLRVTHRVGGAALWAGVAVQAQTPSQEAMRGFDYFRLSGDDGDRLRNERARQIVLGFSRPLGAGLDVRVEAYRRRFDRLLVQRLETADERALRLQSYEVPADLPADSVILEARPTVDPESTGRGTATGVEVLVHRGGRRVSGWLGYTFSRTTREMYGYEFPFDFDRPHAFSAAASVELTRRLRASATWMQASGFPTTPLHEDVLFARALLPNGGFDPIARPMRRADGTFITAPSADLRRLSLRNSDRLSGYSRVDARLTFSTLGRWEIYGEVINLFGTQNYRQEIIIPSSSLGGGGVTNNNIYEQFERLPSFGVRVKF
jgi:TonB dependent receptor/TonB-dependent Receptor Plug Domain